MVAKRFRTTLGVVCNVRVVHARLTTLFYSSRLEKDMLRLAPFVVRKVPLLL